MREDLFVVAVDVCYVVELWVWSVVSDDCCTDHSSDELGIFEAYSC